jgi:hypothetical protein
MSGFKTGGGFCPRTAPRRARAQGHVQRGEGPAARRGAPRPRPPASGLETVSVIAAVLLMTAVGSGAVRLKADATDGRGGVAEAAGGQAGEATELRFHHLHYRVGDPAQAMGHVARTLGGTRVLLQGLGVGVELDDQHVLFDRLDGSEPSGTMAAADAYRQAVAWLTQHGFDPPAAFPAARLAAMLPDEYLDHVAFAAADFDAAGDRLAQAGAIPVRVSDGALLFRPPGGLGIEIVRPREQEDAFWCPMHPDVRAAAEGATCPRCGMDLVAIPPPRIGEYRMDVEVRPAAGGLGAAGLRLVIRDPESGDRVPSFAIVHDRPFHLFIVDRSLEYFEHVHPEPAGEGTFELTQAIPPGEYMLIADFLPQGGTSQTVQRAIVTPGHAGPLIPPAPRLAEGPRERVADGIRFVLDAPEVRARRQATLRVTMSDARTGAPLTDLEPYLGAPAHLLIVNADLTDAVHGHPIEAGTRGPTVTFEPLMPVEGLYKLWVQVQRAGRVVTVPFVVEAVER